MRDPGRVDAGVDLWLRPDYETKAGGDLVIARHFEQALNGFGRTARLAPIPARARNCGRGALHIFNVDRYCEFAATARAALCAPRPLVVSPIHHPTDGVEAFERVMRRGKERALARIGRTPIGRERLKHMVRNRSGRALREAAQPHLLARIASYLAEASLIVVQAPLELAQLQVTFDVDLSRVTEWVPNGVTIDSSVDILGERDIDVLVVARIEERKNQLAIARSLRGTKLRVVFVGGVNPRSRNYNADFQREVTGSRNLTYMPHLPFARLQQFYSRARVLLAASYFEVVSLAELEAVGYGCQLITGRFGYMSDYLGDMPIYIDPTAGKEEMLDAIDRALGAGINVTGASLVKARYSWELSDRALRRAYGKHDL
jgi:glycosyltransferase involved in cell wall biosynthesis